MKNTMNKKLLLSKVLTALVAASTLGACGASINIPYSIATSPTVWIGYPTECSTEPETLPDGGVGPSQCAADGAICLSANTLEFPLHFTVFNAPAGSLVQVRLDRHIGGGRIVARASTSPVLVQIDAAAADAGHLIDVEIVNADGSALTSTQTKNNSHKFQAFFLTSTRTPAISGTTLEAELFCAEVAPCADDLGCDADQACQTRHRGHQCPNFDTQGGTCPLGTCEVKCEADADCAAVHGEICDVASGRCTNCTTTAQCGDPALVCQLTHDPEGSGELAPGLCEEKCTAANVDDVCYFEGETCDVATGLCVEAP